MTRIVIAIALVFACNDGPKAAQTPLVVLHKEIAGWAFDILQAADGLDGATLKLVGFSAAGQHVELWLDPRLRRPGNILVWNASKVLVIDESGGTSRLMILPLEAGQSSDFILCQMLTISQDSRFVAFRRFTTRNSDETAIYALYDVSLSPSANRMTQALDPSVASVDVGWAFYPEENRLLHSYEPATGSFALGSALTWVDDHRLAFLTYRGMKSYVALVDALPGGVMAPMVQETELDETQIVDVNKVPQGIAPASLISARNLMLQSDVVGTVVTIDFEPSPLGILRILSLNVSF